MSLQRLHLEVPLRNLVGLIESIDCLMQDVPIRSMPAEAICCQPSPLPPLAPFPLLSGRILWYKELAIGAFQLWAKAVSRDASRQPAACALTVEQKHYIVSACAPIQRCDPI